MLPQVSWMVPLWGGEGEGFPYKNDGNFSKNTLKGTRISINRRNSNIYLR